MIPFSVLLFEEMRLPMELLAAMLIFMYPFAAKKNYFYLKVIIGYISITAFSLLYFVIFGTDKSEPRYQILVATWYLLFALISPLYAMLCFHVSSSDAALFGGLAFCLQNIIYNVYHVYIAGRLFTYLRTHLIIYILGTIIITFALYFLIYKIYSKILEASEGVIVSSSPQNTFTYTLINVVIYALLIFYQVILKQGYSEFDQLAWLTGTLVSVLILLVQYNAISALVYSSKTKIMENMIRNSDHYYELSKEHIAIINRKCHDLKHQLKALRTVSDEEREDYIREAEKSIIFYQDLVYTNNEALNTILAEKGLFCRENDIVFHCSVDDVDLSFIRVSDLYALLGNAIDNAIEYTKAQTDSNLRSISLRIDKKKNFIGIQISNPISEKDYNSFKTNATEEIKTSKKDSFYHGYGLKSIKYIAEKYNGTMEYSAADEMFTLQIVFNVYQK